jgi:hypothetical protein
LQFAVQLGIPGACNHGLDSLVPEFASEPFAAIKKQWFPVTGAPEGHPLATAEPDIENDVMSACHESVL